MIRFGEEKVGENGFGFYSLEIIVGRVIVREGVVTGLFVLEPPRNCMENGQKVARLH